MDAVTQVYDRSKGTKKQNIKIFKVFKSNFRESGKIVWKTFSQIESSKKIFGLILKIFYTKIIAFSSFIQKFSYKKWQKL